MNVMVLLMRSFYRLPYHAMSVVCNAEIISHCYDQPANQSRFLYLQRFQTNSAKSLFILLVIFSNATKLFCKYLSLFTISLKDLTKSLSKSSLYSILFYNFMSYSLPKFLSLLPAFYF